MLLFYRALLCFVVFCGLSFHLAHAKIYKWVDENGVVHYGQQPAKSVESREISRELENTLTETKFEKVKIPKFFEEKTADGASTPLEIQFNLHAYSIDRKTKSEIKRKIRAMHKAYVDWLGWPSKIRHKIKINIFGKYADFEQYQIQKNGRFSTNRSHYNGKLREIIMLGTEFKDATLGVLYHEASHAIMHMAIGRAPKWINEGLAEVFESSSLQYGGIKFSHNPEWVQRIKHKLREGSLQSFRDYIKISSINWHNSSRREEREYYYIAWSMMRFLVSSEMNKTALKTILLDARRTRWWENNELINVFDRSYPGGINKLDREWRAYIAQMS